MIHLQAETQGRGTFQNALPYVMVVGRTNLGIKTVQQGSYGLQS